MSLQARVKCPRCGNLLIAYINGPGYVECNCHLFCQDGEKPSDCSVTYQNWSGQIGAYVGLDNNPADEGEKVLQRNYYCSTHNKYYYKDKIVIDIDWQEWFSKRAPKELRQSLGEY